MSYSPVNVEGGGRETDRQRERKKNTFMKPHINVLPLEF
jgi:hypothetical protein